MWSLMSGGMSGRSLIWMLGCSARKTCVVSRGQIITSKPLIQDLPSEQTNKQ